MQRMSEVMQCDDVKMTRAPVASSVCVIKETLDAPYNNVGLTLTASPTNSVTLLTALNMIRIVRRSSLLSEE